jgi:hypothetical protein
MNEIGMVPAADLLIFQIFPIDIRGGRSDIYTAKLNRHNQMLRRVIVSIDPSVHVVSRNKVDQAFYGHLPNLYEVLSADQSCELECGAQPLLKAGVAPDLRLQPRA